ncbi:MAG: FtsW/RodA/SpoVE family cell cycle protein [Ferruginibacter sp.]
MPSNILFRRKTESLFFIIIFIVLGLLFLKVNLSLREGFHEVPSRLAAGSMVNLNDSAVAPHVRKLLIQGKYYRDSKDINLAAKALERAYSNNSTIDNIGEINKNAFSIQATEALANGGKVYKQRALSSFERVGFVNEDSLVYLPAVAAKLLLLPAVNVALGKGVVSGNIHTPEDIPVAGAIVKLRLVIPQDSNYNFSISENDIPEVQFRSGIRSVFFRDSGGKKQLQTFTAYAKTGAAGEYSFTGLPEKQAYAVLPLQGGYQFGPSKGTTSLDEDLELNFVQRLHYIKLFSTKDFSSLKKEKSFIVRTPAEATSWLWYICALFLGAFLLLHVILIFKFPEADQFILPALMLLTGISLLTLLSLQDPLRDRFLAQNTIRYFLGGMAGITLLLFLPLRKFTPDSTIYRLFVFKRLRNAANGWPWALGAAGLLVLTILFGSGPEGSGVKVNLLGFQPSEVVKYLLVIFLAGYFTLNEKFIAGYASWNKRFSFFGVSLVFIGLAILLFLILGDLGPAMVACFTFIILFSFSRGDFTAMAGTVILYVLATWLLKTEWLATLVTVAVMVGFMFLLKKKLSESAVMALVIISSFMLLDKMPVFDKLFPGPVSRLTDRKAIWQNPWDNEVYGGDQIANGIWAMSGGGISGQGVGEGNAKTIPEAHTDMILPAIGEEFGAMGMFCIFLVFLLYLHRTINIGRETGRPFLFYLCAGIGISAFVQFLLIAGGSVGALPLSGVALPFISYGGSSLLVNMIAAGFVLAVSRIRGSSAQMKYVTQTQDKNLVPALAAAVVGIILLGVTVSRYIIHNEHWIVEPSLVADRSGVRMYSYNPRINILMNRLQAGNLLDSKGRILATSHPEEIQNELDSLLSLGIDKNQLADLLYKREDRYYPFGPEMFFWTGDANTGIFTGGNNGYFAEYRHAAELRGFPAPLSQYQVVASRYRDEKFLARREKEMMVSKRDFSAIAKLLISGINSQEAEAFKNRNRDVSLTVDAGLQTSLQHILATDDSVRIKRVSVVVMEDNTGNVLASAAWPLPPSDDYEKMTSMNPLGDNAGWDVNMDAGFTHATQPGSTAKLATAMAAFNKLGMAVKDKTILIHPWDLIRTRGYEPDEAGNINVGRAIIKSNNSFFIRLANEEALQEDMATVYMKTGMFLHGVGGYYYDTPIPDASQEESWRKLWRETEFASSKRYNRNNIIPTRAKGISGMAWGQGELVATPASIARLAASISNKGMLMPSRFVQDISGKPVALQPGTSVANNPEYAEELKKYMLLQSQNKQGRLGIYVAGKTGTPERILNGLRINDGWYVFFAPRPNGQGNLVVCIRLEAAKGSSEAVRLAGSYVIPELIRRGYIQSFPAPAGSKPALPSTTVRIAATPGVPGEDSTLKPIP